MSNLTAAQAFQLANVDKTLPIFDSLTPRWVTRFLQWKSLEAGVYRLNKVDESSGTLLDLLACPNYSTDTIPTGSFGYVATPREYLLQTLSAILQIDTKISDVYKQPYDQVQVQLNLGIESIREAQECQLFYNSDYGLLANTADSQTVSTISGPPTPDDLDGLLSLVYKEPTFFAAHPLAIAAFGRECTRRGVPPVVVNIMGGNFITWRGIPIVPTEKLFVTDTVVGSETRPLTNFVLMRTGENNKGVVGLYKGGDDSEKGQYNVDTKYMGIDENGVANYLLSMYNSAAIQATDAIAVLKNVDVGVFYE